MEVGFVTMEKVSNRKLNSVGSSRIRARWVAKYWDEAEEYIIGKDYDCLIFQKAWWETMIEAFKGLKIFDVCDPDWLEGSRQRYYFGLMSECDAVVVNTEALGDYIEKIVGHIPVVCIPDRVDLEEHKQVKKKHREVAKSCVWFGYSHNFHYVERTLNKLANKGLRLTVIADKAMTVKDRKIKVKNVEYNYRTVHEEIIKHDMVLVPETDVDRKGKYKSKNKTLTAWALGMPVIQVPEDLDKFMDVKARKKEGKKRRKEVEEKWDVRRSVKEYKDLIDEIKNREG